MAVGHNSYFELQRPITMVAAVTVKVGRGNAMTAPAYIAQGQRLPPP